MRGVEGGVWCCQAPARVGCLLRSGVGTRLLCPFFSSSQDSEEGLTGVLPPSPGLLWRKRGESEDSSRTGYREALSLPVSSVVGTSAQHFCERSDSRGRGRVKDATAVELAGTLPLPTAGAQGDSGRREKLRAPLLPSLLPHARQRLQLQGLVSYPHFVRGPTTLPFAGKGALSPSPRPWTELSPHPMPQTSVSLE